MSSKSDIANCTSIKLSVLDRVCMQLVISRTDSLRHVNYDSGINCFKVCTRLFEHLTLRRSCLVFEALTQN